MVTEYTDMSKTTKPGAGPGLIVAILVVCTGVVGVQVYAGTALSAEDRKHAEAMAFAERHLDLREPATQSRHGAESRPVASPQAVCGEADLSGLTSLVYVSTLGTDSESCGATPTAACKTVARGIANCAGGGCGVLLRFGLYPLNTTVALAEGVSLYGGCVFDGDPSHRYRTVLQASPDGIPALSATGIDTATTLYGVVVLGSDATTPGQASLAMVVSSSNGLTISHSVLAAGKGADGAQGTSPAQAAAGEGSPKPDGDTGGAGGAGCPSKPGGGGDGGEGGLTATFNFNVAGCFLACKCTLESGLESLVKGQAGDAGGTTSKGGSGGPYGGQGCGCKILVNVPDGTAGDNGATGSCNTQGGSADGNVWGIFSAASWLPTTGGSGGAGGNGGGGGGGGAGGISLKVGNGTMYPGKPGGGGGGGGCGGDGGSGGQQGGASIPLVLIDSNLSLVQNSYIPGPAGRGGEGGQGGQGGAGGKGSAGTGGHNTSPSNVACPNATAPGAGGEGGKGGQGGAGAGSAGGNGGPSMGIALVGDSPAPPNDDGIYTGQPGAAGSKGTGGQNTSTQCRGADGADGLAGGTAAWHSF